MDRVIGRDEDLMVTASVGPYRILRRLGAGGMGEVFLAEDSRLKRQVALKSLSEDWARAPDAQRRLLHEARAAAALNHPNIAAVYDVFQGEETAYIVMEYAAGDTLADRVRAGPLPPSAVAWIGVQLCEALAEAHAHGIIHRDLKPSNLLLTPDGRLKVLDFGVAKTLVLESSGGGGSDPSSSGALDLSQAGRKLVGTPPYLPPEHLVGRPVDERSDIYTAGVVLYELLTGRRPFEGPTSAALAAAILHDTPPGIRARSPSVPEELERVVAKAMARDPEARYRSAAAMKADLERARGPDKETVSDAAPPAEALPRRTRWRGRRKIAVAGASLALLVIGSLAYLARQVALRHAPARVPVLAVLPFVDISVGGGNDYLTLGIPDLLIASLARLPDVNVVSRSATFRNREPTRDLGRIARDAGADFVLDGSVQRAEDQVRVTLNLVQADSQVVVWSNSYEGLSSESFGLQRRVADAVASALSLRLAPADRQKLHDVPSTNQQALEDYYHARAFLERREIPGNADRAVELFQKAVAADPTFAMAHAGLGDAFWWKYEKTKDPEWTSKAQASIGRALELAPELPGVRYSLALVFAGTGRRELAKEELRRLIAQLPGNDDARRLLGQLLLEEGRSEEGLSELRQAVSLRPSWSNYYTLGLAYLDLARYPDAVATYRRLAELQPDRASVFSILGTAYHFAGDREQAAANYRRSIELGATAGAWANLGTVYYTDHKCAEAHEAYEQALRLDPDSAPVLRNLGDALACLGKGAEAGKAYARAIGLAKAVVKVNPSNALGWAKLAVYEAKAGRHADAGGSISRALTLNPSSPEILYWQAVVLALAGRAPEAVVALRSALGRGFSPSVARQDDDLTSLRERTDYRALFETSANQNGRKG